jgi:diacylglycerol kinase family enzyme
VPVGTLNHFAKDLHIPLDLEQAVRLVAAAHVTTIDVGEVNGRMFLNNSSIGVYPGVVVEREALRRRGHRKWVAFVMATAKIVRHYRGLKVRIVADGSTAASRTPFLFVGNNEYRVDGLGMGGRDRLDAGRLSVYLAPRVHGRDLPKLLFRALLGRPTDDTLTSISTTNLHVDTPRHRRLQVAADGEIVVMAMPLDYVVRPAALRVITPER